MPSCARQRRRRMRRAGWPPERRGRGRKRPAGSDTVRDITRCPDTRSTCTRRVVGSPTRPAITTVAPAPRLLHRVRNVGRCSASGGRRVRVDERRRDGDVFATVRSAHDGPLPAAAAAEPVERVAAGGRAVNVDGVVPMSTSPSALAATAEVGTGRGHDTPADAIDRHRRDRGARPPAASPRPARGLADPAASSVSRALYRPSIRRHTLPVRVADETPEERRRTRAVAAPSARRRRRG